MERAYYEAFLRILEEELVPAMGCTEPIAVAYAGALARRALGTMPSQVQIAVSARLKDDISDSVALQGSCLPNKP